MQALGLPRQLKYRAGTLFGFNPRAKQFLEPPPSGPNPSCSLYASSRRWRLKH
jgi:hypothetical protein